MIRTPFGWLLRCVSKPLLTCRVMFFFSIMSFQRLRLALRMMSFMYCSHMRVVMVKRVTLSVCPFSVLGLALVRLTFSVCHKKLVMRSTVIRAQSMTICDSAAERGSHYCEFPVASSSFNQSLMDRQRKNHICDTGVKVTGMRFCDRCKIKFSARDHRG